MKLMPEGTVVDSFIIGECIHAGGMAHIYQVTYTDGRTLDFPLAMKVPKMGTGDGAENIVSFEVEHQIMQVLSGSGVPRFVAAGDIGTLPYLVMEYINTPTLQHWLDLAEQEKKRPDPELVAKIGSAIALSTHQLHKQNCVHQDLKPGNILVKALEEGSYQAWLLDFGLSHHAHYPDLLAEQLRKAIGSPIWIAPEQIVGVRGDARSDIFAIGVMLYEWVTGELPFGAPATEAGMRQRLWMDPVPVRAHNPQAPEWLQEIIMKCLEPEAAKRYQSAALLAFDLANPSQVTLTQRGKQIQGTGFWVHFKRWLKAAGKSYQPSPLASEQIQEVPILMVAVPHFDVSDATLYSLRLATQRSLGIRPGARLACVTVISPNESSTTDAEKSEIRTHSRYLEMMKHWAKGLDLAGHQVSFHVLEQSDVAEALLKYARGNQVSMIIMGAATHGLNLQKFKPTIPIKVAMEAPCTVVLVKQELPFGALLEH